MDIYTFKVTVRESQYPDGGILALAVVRGFIVATGRGDDVIDALNALGSKIGPVIDDKLRKCHHGS